MIENNKNMYSLSSGERAVTGLLDGFLGGLVMGCIVLLVGFLSGDAWLATLSRFNPFGPDPLQGLLMHFGVSAVYGIFFGLIRPIFPRKIPGWLIGLGYGFVLFSLAQLIILPGIASGLQTIPYWGLAAAHVAFGFVLGLRK